METTDTWRADIAASTKKILDDGFYILDGERIDLSDVVDGHPVGQDISEEPRVYTSPSDCQPFEGPDHMVGEEDLRRPFKRDGDGGGNGNIWFTSANAADLAFMSRDFDCVIVNAATPKQAVDDGLLSGRKGGHELELCRRSTLYAYLSSEAAKIMYDANREAGSPLGSDCTLHLPAVSLFRYEDGSLRPDLVSMQVLSVMAPDLEPASRAGISAQSCDQAVLTRIRNTVNIAGLCARDMLILDGWEGASGQNDPKRMAQYFKQVLVDENYASMFDYVIFALPDDKQREIFERIFGQATQEDKEEEEGAVFEDDAEGAPRFTEAAYEFPRCNFTEDIDDDNLGYSLGLLDDGTPFVAERYVGRRNEKGEPARIDMSFMIPSDMQLDDVPDAPDTVNPLVAPGSNVVGYHGTSVARDQGVLHIGMLDAGQDPSLTRTMAAAERLTDAGLLSYNTPVMNGALLYCYDEATQQVVTRFNVTIWEDDLELASTPLRFHPFPVQESGPHLVLLPPRQQDDED